MARQRFIWPSMWTDKSFGELPHAEQVLFVGLFSLADDEGRISADPMFLRAQIFPFKDYTVKKVEAVRNRVVERMENVHMYRIGVDGEEVIALLKWSEYQKPKYPKPSKIPPPFLELSRNDDGSFPPRVGQGWVGLDREGQGREETDSAVEKLSSAIKNKDERTDGMLAAFALKLPAAAFHAAHEELVRKRPAVVNEGGYVRTILERMVHEGQYAA